MRSNSGNWAFNPYRLLAIGLIGQALDDLAKPRHRSATLAWLNGPALAFWCDAAEIAPELVQSESQSRLARLLTAADSAS